MISPIGKWAGLHDTEYVEYHIDSSIISIYSLWQANLGSIRYRMENDSLFYYDLNYSVGINRLNDTTIILSTSESSDTLYRLSNSTITFDEVDINDSIALRAFYDMVFDRGLDFYSTKGMVFDTVEEDSRWESEFDFEMDMIE